MWTLATTHLEPLNLILQIISLKGIIAIQLPITPLQIPQTALPLPAEQHIHRHTASRNLIRITWANSLAGSPNLASSSINPATRVLDNTIDRNLHIKADMCAIRDEDALLDTVQALHAQRFQLREERRDMHDAAGANQVLAVGIDQAGREDVEVVGDAVGDNGVAGIVATGGATAECALLREDVDELAFAFVTPLGAEDDGGRHRLVVIVGVVCRVWID